MDEGECGQCSGVESTSKASSGEGRNLAKFEVENVEALSMFVFPFSDGEAACLLLHMPAKRGCA